MDALDSRSHLAIQAGWFTHEVGRQPWVVYGPIRTSAGTSDLVVPELVWLLFGYAIIYAVVGVCGFYVERRIIKEGPDFAASAPVPPNTHRAAFQDPPSPERGLGMIAIRHVGIVSLGAGREDRRTVMIASIFSIWDANESWLIVAARALFGAFPLAYAVIPSALYVPIIAILFDLILRAVAFEFHELSQRKRVGGLSSALAAS